MRVFQRFVIGVTALCLLVTASFVAPKPVWAAASMYLTVSPATINPGDTVTVGVYVSTGESANTFEGTISYPSSLFDAVRGSRSGSICSLWINEPDPSGGSASYSCGTPAGYSGTGLIASIVLTAKAAGEGSFGLGGCTVLANDGQGSDITGGCSGKGVAVTAKATPTPAASTPTPTPKQAKPSGTPIQQTKAAETPKPTTPPAAAPTPPPAQALPSETPTPSPTITEEATPTPGPQAEAKRRSIGVAFGDLFKSVKEFRPGSGDLSGVVALLLTLVPVLGLMFAITFFAYRLYLLERRRRRTLDRLFEMELSELAALEGKMDLLAEKGSKGREQYREEFAKAKENILRQLKPDYGKPVAESKETPPATPPDKKTG